MARTLELPQFPAEFIDAYLLPGLSHSSIISIGKLCDAVCKAIFNEQTVNITGKRNRILKVWRDHQTGLWSLPLNNQKKENKTSMLSLTNKQIMWTRQQTYQTYLNIYTQMPSDQSNQLGYQK